MIKLLPLVLALSVFRLPSCSEPAKPPPQLDERHVITLDGTTLRYNGKELRWDVPADRWQEVLGPRSRQWDRGRVSVWDDLGLYLYVGETSDRKGMPDSFDVLLGRKRHSAITDTEPDFWPKQNFRGRLLVDGALIHKDSTMQEIMVQKKGVSFRRGYLPTIYSYDLDQYYVRLDFGHDGTPTTFSVSPPQPETSKDPGKRDPK